MTTLVLTWACHPSSVVQNSFLGFNSCHLWDPQPREGKFFCCGCVCACVRVCVRACVPVFVGGGGLGLRRGGSLVNFSQIGEGQTCFIRNRGRATVFLARKITSCRLVVSYLLTKTRSVYKPKTCIYKQSYQPRLI